MSAIIESMNAWGARFAGFALPMLLQSAVLIALLFALDLALRKRVRATIRYAVWMLALVKLALPPSLASPTGAAYWLPAEAAGIYSAPAPTPAVTPEETVVKAKLVASVAARGMTPLHTGSPRLTWQAVSLAVWLAVALVVVIWAAWRLRMVVGVVRKSAEAPEAVQAILASCRRQMGIKRLIPVRCAAIGSPAICGVLRPIILMPPGLVENLNGSEMRSVLLHELAHYKRCDLLVNHAQILLQIVYWYNPLVWLANASIRRTREQAVDEMVLVEMGGEAQAYPATLLHVAKLGLGRPLAAVGLMGILEPGRGLRQRILHIMNRPLPRTARIGAGRLAAVLVLALVALPMAFRRETEISPEAIWIKAKQTHFTEKQLADLAARLKSALHARPKETSGWPKEELQGAIMAFGSQRASAFAVLREAAVDPNLEVRLQAVSAMEFIAKDVPEVAPFLWKVVQAYKSDAPNFANVYGLSVSDVAFTALRTTLTARDLPAVTELLVSPQDMGSIGRYSTEAIAQIINKDVAAAKPFLPELEGLLDHTNAGVRFRAACALAPLEAATNPKVLKEIGANLAVKFPYRELVDHSNREQQRLRLNEISVEHLMALESLQKIGPAAKPLLGALREFAASEEGISYQGLASRLVTSLEKFNLLENAKPDGAANSAPTNASKGDDGLAVSKLPRV